MTSSNRSWMPFPSLALAVMTWWAAGLAPIAAGQVDERCTASVGGRTVDVAEDGSFRIPNVPAASNLVQVQVVCVQDGITLYGVSEFLEVVDGQTFNVSDIVLSPVPIPTVVSLDSAPDDVVLTSIDQTTQVRVTADFSDGTMVDVTAREDGSTYVSSNPSIVSVDAQGVAKAVGRGTALITVSNRGATTVTAVSVSPGDPLTQIEGFVVLPDGTPVAGATVTLLDFGGTDVTDSAGKFCIGCSGGGVPSLLGPLNVLAEADVGGATQVGLASGLTPIPEGLTDGGLIQLSTTNFWISSVDGDWNDGAHWTDGAPPAVGDDAVISRCGTYVVTLNTNPSVDEFLLDHDTATLRASSRTLTIDGAGEFRSGVVDLINGTVQGSGGLENRATIIAQGTSRIRNPLVQRGELFQRGGSGSLTFESLVENWGVVALEPTGGSALTLTSTGPSLVNELRGLIEVRNGVGSATINAEIENHGTVTLDHDTQFTLSFKQFTNEGDVIVTPRGQLRALNGTFLQNSGSLQLDGPASITGTTFDLQGGRLIGDQLFSTTGDVHLQGVSLEDHPRFLIDGSADLTVGVGGAADFTMRAFSNLFGTVANEQLVEVKSDDLGSATVTVDEVSNHGTMTLTTEAGSSRNTTVNVTSGKTLTNETDGRLEVRSGTGQGTRTISGNVTNLGEMVFDYPTTLSISFDVVSNQGTMTASAPLTVSNGTFRQEAGLLSIQAPTTLSFTLFEMTGGQFELTAPLTTTGDVFLTGGQLTGSPQFALGSGSDLTLGVSDPAVFTFEGTTTSTGDLAVGQSLVAQSTDVTSTTTTLPASVSNRGTIGLTTTASASRTTTLAMGGSETLTIETEGWLEMLAGTGQGTRRYEGNLQNFGTVFVDHPSTFAISFDSVVNEGTFEITPNGSVDFINGTYTQNSGLSDFQGDVTASGTSFDWNGGTLRLTSFEMSGGSLDIDGTTVEGTPSFGLTGGSITLGPGFGDAAQFRLRGAVSAAGDIETGQTVTIEADGFNATTTWIASFANRGTLQLTSATAHSANLAISGGALTNESDGLIEILAGAGGARSLGVQFDNQGTVRIDSDTTLGLASVASTNGGTIDFGVSGATAILRGSSFVNESTGQITGTGTILEQVSALLNEGAIVPGGTGGAGTLAITGDLELDSVGRVLIELGGTAPGDFDVLATSGTLSLAGELEVSLLSGFQPQLGDLFDVATFGSRSGVFDSFTGLDLGGGLELQVTYESNSVRLEVVSSS